MHTITVFGAGAQAYWHIRLALILRAPEIHHVNIIARNFHRAKDLLAELYRSESTNPTEPSPFPDPEHNPEWIRGVKFTILTPDYQDYARLLREHVRSADAIMMCTPSPTPLFPHEHLTSTEGRRKGRFVAAIGSYKPHMCELHPEVLKAAVKPERGRHHHKHAANGGAIIVDTLEGAMRESGEVRQAGLKGEEMVEIGELVMLKRAMAKDGEDEGGLVKWLQEGNVVYKSVGLGLMDVVVGSESVRIANERNMGTVIDGF
jgi:ornithine cyclodeaminase/alanine dehydrogenase-like protein (mu-crystallin family)